MSAYIRCMGCYEATMDIDSLICSECGYESGMSEIKALSTRIADLERQLAQVTAERDALKTNFERECQDGDRLAKALGVPRTEGGSLQVQRMLNAIDALKIQAGTLATAFRVNMLRLSQKITHEEIDKVLADVAQKAVDAEREIDALRVDAERLDELQRRYLGANFAYGPEAMSVLIIDIHGCEVMADLRKTIDAARGAK